MVICLSGIDASSCFCVACGVAQQWANGPSSFFHLPERIASMLDFAERVQRADACQRDQFFAVEFRHTRCQIIDRLENAIAASRS